MIDDGIQGYNGQNQIYSKQHIDIFSANEGFYSKYNNENLLETLNQNKEINDENSDYELYSKDEGMLDNIDTPNHPALEDLLEDNITKENNMHAPFAPEVDQKILKESVTDHPHSDTKIGVTSNVSKTITDESISSDDSEYSSKENPKKKTKRGRRAQPKKVSKSSNRQEKKMKSYLVQKDLDVKTLLSDALYNHINGGTISISDKPKRGRPKKNIKVSKKDLEVNIKVWGEDLDRKIEKGASKGRTDALDVTIKRKIGKIPDVCLKYVTTKSQYKSKDLAVSLEAYIQSFIQAFVPLTNYQLPINYAKGSEEESRLIRHFFDFGVLSFPKDRVKRLLNMYEEDPFSSHLIQPGVEQLEVIGETSLASFYNLYSSNSCLKQICDNISSFFELCEMKNKDRVVHTLLKIENF